MKQVFLGGLNIGIGIDLFNGGFELVKGSAQKRMYEAFIREERGPVWTQNTQIELAIEEGDFKPVGGDCVAMALRNAMNQSLETKASEVVGHLGRSVGGAEQSGHARAQVAIAEASRKMGKGGEGLQKRHYPGIAETESRSALSRLAGWSLYSIECVLG